MFVSIVPVQSVIAMILLDPFDIPTLKGAMTRGVLEKGKSALFVREEGRHKYILFVR